MFKRWPAFFVVLPIVGLIATRSFAQEQAHQSQPSSQLAQQGQKDPSKWTDMERVDALMDHAAAVERVRRYMADLTTRHRDITAQEADAAVPLDVIVGRRDPHLFFPADLLRQLVKLAYADDATIRTSYRESLEPQRVAKHLPADFWQRLEVITAAYRSDRARELELPESGLSEPDMRAAVDLNSQALCRDQRDALREANAVFGDAFPQFMYAAVAPSVTRIVLRNSTREELLAFAKGDCQ